MSKLKFAEYSNTKNPKYLVIFLHGYGANGANLLGLSQEFIDVLDEAHYIAPNAPQDWEGGFPDCYQWFSLYSGFDYKAIEDMAIDIKKSQKILSDFIDEQLKRFSLTRESLFLVGFSQGGMMSLYQGFASTEKFAGVISFSGKLVLPEFLDQETSSKPNICLIHGEDDSVVPFENFVTAKDTLTDENIAFESKSVPGLEHSIDITGVNFAKKFIQTIIKK